MVVSSPTVNADEPSSGEKLGIREILEADIPDVTDVLTRGFPCPRRYWETGLERLRTRSTPAGFPRYGFVLEADGKPIGVILLISSVRNVDGHLELFSNLSS